MIRGCSRYRPCVGEDSPQRQSMLSVARYVCQNAPNTNTPEVQSYIPTIASGKFLYWERSLLLDYLLPKVLTKFCTEKLLLCLQYSIPLILISLPCHLFDLFIEQVGVTMSQVVLDPSMLDACVRDILNVTAPRYVV